MFKKFKEEKVTDKLYKMLFIRAFRLMVEAHKGQVDKVGRDYYHHPIEVAKMARSLEEAIVSLLHDVLEDTWVTTIDLYKMGFPAHIINAVVSVTRREGEIYREFIVRAGKDPLGRKTKYWDNSKNLGRNHELPIEMRSIARRYRKSMDYLSPLIDWDEGK